MIKSIFTWVVALRLAAVEGDPTVNQCGNVAWDYAAETFPVNEAQVAAAIQNAVSNGLPLKVIGDKHSFSPLDVTTGVMLSLDQFTGQAYHVSRSSKAIVPRAPNHITRDTRTCRLQS
jgi:FAD/FMN-containing dehydrogenase